jgi:pilus assembly protein CpaB
MVRLNILPKVSNTSLLFGGAIVLGIGFFFGSQHYLRTYISAAEEKLAGQYTPKRIVVAATDIQAGDAVGSNNVAARNVPTRFVSSNALSPDDFDSIDGQKVVVALRRGDPIERGQLERPDRPAFSATLVSGDRAITFPVDEISSISGMLVPGDSIDLLYTGPGVTQNSFGGKDNGGTGPKELLHVRPILQAVPVLATGKTTQKRVISTQDGGSKEVNVDFTTVTLQVLPSQAEEILMAQKLGALTAVLRSPTDAKTTNLDPLDETAFKRVSAGPRAKSSVRRADYVEIITGGTGQGAQRYRAALEDSPLAALLGVGQRPMSRSAAAGPAPAAAPAPPNAYDAKARMGISDATTSSSVTGLRSITITP